MLTLLKWALRLNTALYFLFEDVCEAFFILSQIFFIIPKSICCRHQMQSTELEDQANYNNSNNEKKKENKSGNTAFNVWI